MQNKKPSPAVEKAWLARVAEYGCIITKESCIQIHHPLGREAKQNKYHIGRFFANPLTIRLHDVGSNDPLNVTHHRKAFVEKYGDESVLFQYMCYELEEDGPLPFTEEEMAAIMATKR